MSHLEEELLLHVRLHHIPVPVREYKFNREVVGNEKGVRARLREAGLKDSRFDFAWLDQRFAVEVEGGSWSGGRHTRGKGFEDDCIKYGQAMINGWMVYRCTGGMIKSGLAIKTIKTLLNQRS